MRFTAPWRREIYHNGSAFEHVIPCFVNGDRKMSTDTMDKPNKTGKIAGLMARFSVSYQIGALASIAAVALLGIGVVSVDASSPGHDAAKAPHATDTAKATGKSRGSLAERLAKKVKARQGAKPAAAHGGGHWGYGGDGGPAHWGALKQDYHVCGDGRMQSPIDIAGGFKGAGDRIKFDYNQTPLSIVHNGHTVQANYAPGSGITVSGKRYELLQFHFHTPSEHAVGHKRTAMEVHFVHKSADGQLAVVGAMMRIGAENRALRKLWSNMPMKAGPAHKMAGVRINGLDLLPKNRSYHRYMGSLTTPPCSEGVNWFVLKQPLQVGAGQVDKFTTAVSVNARPLQALNNRLVLTPTAKN